MILVMTGSTGAPFDRLLATVERFDVSDEIMVQHGPSRVRPAGARCFGFLPFHQLAELVREARIVVAHAGVGSILLCASQGHRPLVVPRLARFGEVVDDHQLDLARRLNQVGAVQCVEDPEDLPALLPCLGTGALVNERRPEGAALVADLKCYLDAALD